MCFQYWILHPFCARLVSYLDKEEQLLSKYILPHADRLSLLETLTQPLSKDNYRLWMHEMLYLEELAELAFIQRYMTFFTWAVRACNKTVLQHAQAESICHFLEVL